MHKVIYTYFMMLLRDFRSKCHLFLKLMFYLPSLKSSCSLIFVISVSLDGFEWFIWIFKKQLFKWFSDCFVSFNCDRNVILNFNNAAAKSLQSCPTLRPHRWQPTRLLHPWDFPGKSTGVEVYSYFFCYKS